ncbi:hypothetical protein T4A_12072 [Trichinella pseudospiralis]|uniref:Uncharacterized protein n=1 Tax=Trichinella pseudospiralis TaxID=6337 RepID=A0A0V1EF24_TRIPS|nr:hypothetical protein T4A_12072 [Trichinella pseudospiralis]
MNKAHHLLNNCVRYAGDFYRHSERMLKSVHFAVNGPFVEMLSTKILILSVEFMKNKETIIQISISPVTFSEQHKKNNTNVNNQVHVKVDTEMIMSTSVTILSDVH